MSASFVYITVQDKEQASRIGRALVDERLVACVNILPDMTSMYWWEGQVQQSTEAVLIAKTVSDLVEPVIERVKSLHTYECPCAVAWPIETGNAEYLDWIRASTQT